MDLKPIYLIMIDPNFGDLGHNKYYHMIPQGDTFLAEYGRVGAGKQTKVYPISKWNSTLSSKKKKGYVERTELMQDIINDTEVKTEEVDKFSSIKIESIRNIIKRLFDFANKTIQSSYKVTANEVTQNMVDKAQELLDEITSNYKNYSLEEFNNKLVELFIIIPRKMKRVSDFTAKDMKTETIEKILINEQSILDTMAGQVYKPKIIEKNTNTKNNNFSILDEMGIEMEDCSEDDIKKIKEAMGDSADKFYKAWRVRNFETEKAYQKFTKENNIGNVKLLCHGSRNQNIFNILSIGLKIRPSCAMHTGSMLGDALYYSNPEKKHGGVTKSIGYTSLSGSYWAGGNSDCGFLIFFDVALGKSYDIYNFDSKFYTYNLEKLQKDCPGAWSLHLHGVGYRNGGTVMNDEITVYNVNQVTVRYLVEIRR